MNRFLFEAAKWLVLAIAALMLYEVISRYSFASPTSWAPELATLLFGPFFLLGGPYLLHSGGHVSVDLLTDRLQGTTKKAFIVAEIILAVAFGGILFWFAYPLAVDSFNYRETSFTSWNPQIWPSKAVLPLAMALLIMQSFAELVFVFLEEEAKR
ncbi:MAG: TRAP transporter small permease subunit [Paracoccaceae bacterium]